MVPTTIPNLIHVEKR